MSDKKLFRPDADVSGTIAVYPGTFDPITSGHLDIIKRSLVLFDHVIVAIAQNPGKKTLFSMEERLQMIRDCFPDEKRINVAEVDGLLVDYAYMKGAKA
ncbi:MAG: adenylyltransferase/cytidyltransferase family protein, partial [Desulfobulbaceae bacterium]|nr:adenylyltransferase/cytidyltransferase family protein [Desulfobulbaceae bacterium]